MAINLTQSNENENIPIRVNDGSPYYVGARAYVEQLSNGAKITVIDKEGTTIAIINDGNDGADGADGADGVDGITPSISIGTVETLEPTEDAYVTRRGTDAEPIFDVGIPKGEQGDVNLSQLGALLPTETASGEMVTISDGQSVVPVKSLHVALEPIQDLHGYDKPWVGGAGKNLLPMTLASLKAVNTLGTWSGNTYTRNGITFTVLTDANDNVMGIRANGTATAETTFYQINNTKLPLASGQYIFNGCPSGGGDTTYRMQARIESTWHGDTGSGITFTYDASTTGTDLVRIDILNGAVCNNVVFLPMIRLASVSDATYEPYTNICPISGRTSVDTIVSPTTSATDGRTYTTALGRTVYGGTLDVVSGVLTVDMTFRTFNGSEKWETINQGLRLPGGFGGKAYSAKNVSNMLTYATSDPTRNPNSYQFTVGGFVNVGVPYTVAEWKSLLATNNLQIAYELNTPQTYQLTPQEVELLVGENNVWSDGEIEVMYNADIQLYIQKMLG